MKKVHASIQRKVKTSIQFVELGVLGVDVELFELVLDVIVLIPVAVVLEGQVLNKPCQKEYAENKLA